MKSKVLICLVRVIVVLALAAGGASLAQTPNPTDLHGVINDYTPATATPPSQWEIRGPWTLTVQHERGTADFSAALTMELSDISFLPNPLNVNSPTARTQHTHHITMTGAKVSQDTSGCPVNNPVTTSAGFVITGPVSITGNGNPAPFEAKGPSSLQVCITGGAQVQFSNVTLVFSGPAAGHFSSQAIHGVVRNHHKPGEGEADSH
jgi:hypothetical protein